jgi:hypothetical protein
MTFESELEKMRSIKVRRNISISQETDFLMEAIAEYHKTDVSKVLTVLVKRHAKKLGKKVALKNG